MVVDNDVVEHGVGRAPEGAIAQEELFAGREVTDDGLVVEGGARRNALAVEFAGIAVIALRDTINIERDAATARRCRRRECHRQQVPAAGGEVGGLHGVGVVDVEPVAAAIVVAQIHVARHVEAGLTVGESEEGVPQTVVQTLDVEGDGGTVLQRQAVQGIGHADVALAAVGAEVDVHHTAIAQRFAVDRGGLGGRALAQQLCLVGLVERVGEVATVEAVVAEHALLPLILRHGVLLGSQRDVVVLRPVVGAGAEAGGKRCRRVGRQARGIVEAVVAEDGGLRAGPLQRDVRHVVLQHAVEVVGASQRGVGRDGRLLVVQLPCQFVLRVHLVSPDVDAAVGHGREADALDAALVHELLEDDAVEGGRRQSEGEVAGAVVDAPCAVVARLGAADGAVVVESDGDGRHLLHVGIVHLVLVDDDLVGAGNVLLLAGSALGDVVVGELLAVILEGRGDDPSLLVEEQLVDAHLVAGGAVVELGVVDQVGASVGCSNGAVVTLCALADGLESPLVVCTHELRAAVVGAGTVVLHVAAEDGGVVVEVLIGAVGVLRAEDTHLVAAVGGESAVADEEEVVVADALDVGALARDVVSAANLLAEVGVAGDAVAGAVGRRVGDVVVAQTCLLVELQHPDAAAPRAVDEPQASVGIVEGRRVDGVWPAPSPAVAHGIARWQAVLRAKHQLQVGAFIAVATVLEAADDDRPLVGVGSGDAVGGEQDDAGVPGVAVDAEVHAPLLHRGVPDDVGCPHVAVDVVAGVGAGRPLHGVELWEVDFLAALLHLFNGRGDEGGTVVVRAPRGVGLRPVLQVGGVGSGLVRAEDVVALVLLVVDHRGVVNADPSLRGVAVERLGLLRGELLRYAK